MNFAEGTKRIYIVISCMVAIVYLGSQVRDFPTKEDAAPWLMYQLKDAAQEDWQKETNQKRFVVDFGDASGTELLKSLCKDGQVPGVAVAKVCRSFKEWIEDTPWRQAKFVGTTLLVVAAIASFAVSLWLLLAWIGRGFGQKP